MQAYARVMMDLEIKLAKKVYGKPRKTARPTGEKMQTVGWKDFWSWVQRE